MKKPVTLFLSFILTFLSVMSVESASMGVSFANPSLEKESKTVKTLSPEEVEMEESLSKGQWKEVQQKTKRMISRKKKDPIAWTYLGRTYLLQRKNKKAIRRFKKALKYDPQYAAAYYWKGKAFEARKKWDEAANEYQAAIHADPNMTEAESAWKQLKEKQALPN